MRALHFLSNPRSLLAMLHDVCMVCFAWAFAYYLRFNFNIPNDFIVTIWQNLAWVLPLQVGMFFAFGLYQGIWRFASIPDLKRLLKAVAVSVLMASVEIGRAHV